MPKGLQPHAQRVYEALVRLYGEKNVNLETPGQFRSPCPAHGGDGLNMVSYFDESKVTCCCFSNKCDQLEIRKALGLTATDLTANAVTGCTLEQYSAEKRLPIDDLAGFGLRDCRYGNKPAVKIPYWDRHGKLTGNRFRVSTTGKDRVRSPKDGGSRLYGTWKLDLAITAGRLVIVEGESDCHTLWHHGIPTVGVPGAQQVNVVMPDLVELAEQNPDVEVLIVQESDLAGRAFVRSFQQTAFADRIKVLTLGEFKDPSDMHCDHPGRFKKRWEETVLSGAGLEQAILGFAVNELADLRPEVERVLTAQSVRTARTEISRLLIDFLVRRERLMHEEVSDGNLVPYALLEGAAVMITDDDHRLRTALHEAGLNPIEPHYRFVVAELILAAQKQGRQVELCRYSTHRNRKLYISSGPRHLVTLESSDDGSPLFKLQPNGLDGVLFAADSCFPFWEPEILSSGVGVPQAFRPTLQRPPEASGYTAGVQLILFQAWLAGLIAGCRLPILVCQGDYGSGKSVLAKAVAQLFMGPKQGISQVPSDPRSFYAASANLPLYAIDNLDGIPPSWMEDAIAAATTGAEFVTRTLYTTDRLSRRALTSRYVVTTRTASFTRRKDIEDRALPLFFGQLEQWRRLDEVTLLDQVHEARNRLLSSLCCYAYCALFLIEQKGALPSRFQDFAHMVLLVAQGSGETEDSHACLLALEAAQKFALHDPDPLTRALIECRSELSGTATRIFEELQLKGYKRLPSGEGKHKARRLRECRRALQLNGDDLLEEQKGNTTHFRVVRNVQ